MTIMALDVSLASILRALATLKECGLDVETMTASPWAYEALVREFGGDPTCMEKTELRITSHGAPVRITVKAPLTRPQE